MCGGSVGGRMSNKDETYTEYGVWNVATGRFADYLDRGVSVTDLNAALEDWWYGLEGTGLLPEDFKVVKRTVRVIREEGEWEDA
jgi:hypothetical protein